MRVRRILLLITLAGLLVNKAWPCTVPVFRYALERWSPDYHIMTVSSKLDLPIEELNRRHDANLWFQEATTRQRTEVQVTYPGSDQVWFEGDWHPSLPDHLSDSPLRREIAKELLTGATATWIFLEGADSQSSSEVFERIKLQLGLLADQIKFVDAPDYEDELDGYAGPGGPLSSIPLRVHFPMHRLSRDNPEESLLVRQISGAIPDSAMHDEMIAAVIFGQGRMILLSENELLPEIVVEVCYFLCGECSCRIKAINPGLDLLMAVNWHESVVWYPEHVMTYLPGGTAFSLSDTIGLETGMVDDKQDADSYALTLLDNRDAGTGKYLLNIVLVSLIPVLLIIYLGGRFLLRKRKISRIR